MVLARLEYLLFAPLIFLAVCSKLACAADNDVAHDVDDVHSYSIEYYQALVALDDANSGQLRDWVKALTAQDRRLVIKKQLTAHNYESVALHGVSKSVTTGNAVPLGISPSQLSFGTINVGETSTSQTATVTNTGPVSLQFQASSPRIVSYEPGYSIVGNTCGPSIAAGASCTISVTFAPQLIGTSVSTFVAMQFVSYIDLKTITITGTGAASIPYAPSGAIATPGNSQVQVQFVAPAVDGGKPVLGYTVTSIPPGGVDSNAGSTATTHSVTSLTNGVAYSFTVTATNAVGVSVPSAPSNVVTPGTLDVDASVTASKYDALTDGVLTLRYLFGITGTALTNNAVGSTATMTNPTVIKAYLDAIRPLLDVDGNGTADARTDGLLIIRYLFGLRGNALIAGAFDPLGTRITATAIEDYLQSLLP